MISSPCSAEQAQRIKLCPRKSPPQSFPPIAQQAPGHFVRGLCCSRAAQPAAEAAGARPASNEIHEESPRTTVRGLPMRFIQNPPRSRSHTAAGELEGARPASNQIVRRRKACSSRLSGEAAAQGTPARPQIKKSPESDSGDFLLMLWFTQRSCRSRRERRPAQRPERLRERQRRQPDRQRLSANAYKRRRRHTR